MVTASRVCVDSCVLPVRFSELRVQWPVVAADGWTTGSVFCNPSPLQVPNQSFLGRTHFKWLRRLSVFLSAAGVGPNCPQVWCPPGVWWLSNGWACDPSGVDQSPKGHLLGQSGVMWLGFSWCFGHEGDVSCSFLSPPWPPMRQPSREGDHFNIWVQDSSRTAQLQAS